MKSCGRFDGEHCYRQTLHLMSIESPSRRSYMGTATFLDGSTFLGCRHKLDAFPCADDALEEGGVDEDGDADSLSEEEEKEETPQPKPRSGQQPGTASRLQARLDSHKVHIGHSFFAEGKVPKIDACSIHTLGQIFQDSKRFEDWLVVARKPCGGLM